MVSVHVLIIWPVRSITAAAGYHKNFFQVCCFLMRPTTTDKSAFLRRSQPPLGVEAHGGPSLTSFLATRLPFPTSPSSGNVLEILNLVTQFTVKTSLSCTISSASWSFCLLPSCCPHSLCFIWCFSFPLVHFFYIKLWFNQLCLLHWDQFQTTTTATFKILRQTQQSLLCHLGSCYNFLAAITALSFLFPLY